MKIQNLWSSDFTMWNFTLWVDVSELEGCVLGTEHFKSCFAKLSSKIGGISIIKMTKVMLRKVTKLSKLTQPSLGEPGQSLIFVPVNPQHLFTVHKTSSPLYHQATQYSEESGLVHLSRMLIHSNLFYCFRFPSGRYLCSQFHTYRNDIYRPFQKMALKWCSRYVRTDPDNQSACSPLFSPHSHPE